jgi:hypothetical protein
LDPIAFQGKFEAITHQAFLTNLCQVWARPEGAQFSLLAEATGATMQLHIGQYAGSTVSVWHQGNAIDLDGVQRGESRWNVGGKLPAQQDVWGIGELDHTKSVEQNEKDDMWGEKQVMDWDFSIQHVEEWDASQGSVSRDFPGEISRAFGEKGVIQLSREDEILFGQCGFSGGNSSLFVEHCSDVQALLLGYVLMDCKVSGSQDTSIEKKQSESDDDYFYY